MNQSHEDFEILDLFLILWRDKWIVITSAILGIAFGYFYFLNSNNNIDKKEPLYESKIFFYIDKNLPANLAISNEYKSNNNMIKNYHYLFYSKDIFQEWRNKNKQSQITIDDFNDTQIINNHSITNSKKIFIKFNREDERHITIRSKQIPIFDEIFSYAKHVSEAQSKYYLSKYKNFYEKINLEFKDFNETYPESASAEFIFYLIKIDNFISSINKNTRFVNITHLENPKNINITPSEKKYSYLEMIVFAIFGGMIGAIFIFIRNILLRNNKKFTKL